MPRRGFLRLKNNPPGKPVIITLAQDANRRAWLINCIKRMNRLYEKQKPTWVG